MYIFMFMFIYICFADAVKVLQLEIFKLFSQFIFKIQAFSSKLLPRSGIFFQVTSKIRHFLPSYFQDRAFSSKLLPGSGIFFHITSKIHTIVARSCKTKSFLPRSSKIPARIMHCLSRSWK